MSQMVERVAKALFVTAGGDLSEIQCEILARAAIKAMHQPPQAMQNALPKSIKFGADEATIEQLGLSTRSRNCLHNECLRSVVSVVRLHRSDFLRMPNFGVKCLEELEKALASHGLKLLGDHPTVRDKMERIERKEHAEFLRLKGKYE